MSLGHGARIVTDGLVFAYDMGSKQSWKGEPTTNLAKNTSGNIDWTVSQLNIPISRTTIIPNQRYLLTTTSLTGSSWRMYFNLAYLVDGQTYTLSFKYKILSGGPTFYAGDWCDTSVTRATTDLGNGVYYQTATGTRSTYNSTYRFMDFVQSNDTVVEIWDIQLEQRAYATPYVESKTSRDRITTDAILDWAGGNTITASSLTYSSDNTFSFNGTNDAITIPSLDFPDEQTVEIWLQPLENDGARRNPYNQAYGGYGTWTHEPNGTISHYWGDAGGNTTPYTSISSAVIAQNEIACICLTRDLSTVVTHKNGIATASKANPYGSLTTHSSTISIGNGYAGRYLGNIFSVKLYNRALSLNEVQQNFNALRGRFGV